MPKDVKCTISSCEYWTSGNGCSAKEIEVDDNTTGSPYMEVGEIGSESAARARTSSQTCCRTMKPKNNE
ncbi:MAG TPA: DUF1540 domain-containing protein [Firmicutes bacterium]|nr:DUF1540 domain-containing protein [Bacillota bacterium]